MIADIACAERGCACHDPRIDGPGVEMVPSTAVLQERKRCAKLIQNLMQRNADNALLSYKLKELLRRVQNPKSTGRAGGLSNEQLVLPLDN